MTHPTPPTDPVEGIRKALEARPTDGPWSFNKLGAIGPVSKEDDQSYGMVIPLAWIEEGLDECAANKRFIAACNPAAIRELLDRLDSAERALRNVKRVIGPCVPECSGCYEEWSEALRIIDAAIDEQLRSVGEKEPK